MDTDILAQAEAIKRRRAMFDQSRQLAMQAPIQGNFGQALGQVLAKLGTAWIAKSGNDELDQQDTANRQAYSDKLKGELENYLTTMQGSPEVVDPREASGMGPAGMGGSIAGPSQGRPAVAANPREAAVRAITSQLPEVRALGQAAFADLGKQKQRKTMEVNKRLVDAETGEVIKDLTDKPEEWVSITIPGADGRPVQAQQNKLTGKIDVLDKSPKVQVNNGSGQKAAENALGGEVPKVLQKAREDIIAAQDLRNNSGNILRLIRDPQTIAGIAATPAGFLAGLGSALGLTGPEAASQTQQLIAAMAQSTLDANKELKGATSDKDIKFLQEAAAGRIQNTPEAIADVATLAMVSAHNKEMRARNQWKGTVSVPGAESGAAMYPLPEYGNMELPEDALVQERPGGLLAYGGRKRGTTARNPAGTPPPPVKPVMTLEEALGYYKVPR